MAYIGKGPQFGILIKQTLLPNGSTTLFDLDYKVANATSLLVVYNGIVQEPDNGYSIASAGSKIQFSFTPIGGSSLFLIYLGSAVLQQVNAGYSVGVQNILGNGIQNAWTLNETPTVNSSVLVFVGGIQKRLGDDYTIVANTITFSSAPGLNVKVDIVFLAKERISVQSVADGAMSRVKLDSGIRNSVGTWTVVSTNTSVVDGAWYMVDTLGGSKTLTMPVAPSVGDTVKIVDLAGTFATNNCIVARNGKKIDGVAADLTISVSRSVTLVFSGDTYGWKVL